MYRVAVDTGGTFTDIIVSSDDGVLEYAKVPTTDDLEICRCSLFNLHVRLWMRCTYMSVRHGVDDIIHAKLIR